jgi:hypothetical protein
VIAQRLVARPVVARGFEIIDQVDDQVCAPALPGEAVVIAVKLVAVESEAEFHGDGKKCVWPLQLAGPRQALHIFTPMFTQKKRHPECERAMRHRAKNKQNMA